MSYFSVSLIISFLLVLECCLCFLQYSAILASYNTLFSVTGSIINPNITAMYLALGFPMICYQIKVNKKAPKFFQAIMLVILSTLLMLKCRTAIMGFLICAVYLFFAFNNSHVVGLRNLGKNKKRVIVSMVSVISLFSFFILYNAKIASSESRIFIWKICSFLAIEKPIFGHGLGSFVREYNLAQAFHFQNNTTTLKEEFNSSYIRTGYNDYIQNFVEVGSLGSALYIIFLFSLIWIGIKCKSKDSSFHSAFAGVLIFIIMSLFNSLQYTVTLFALLIFYASTLIFKNKEQQDKLFNFKISNLFLEFS